MTRKQIAILVVMAVVMAATLAMAFAAIANHIDRRAYDSCLAYCDNDLTCIQVRCE